jgi:hypothetical protein
MKSMTSRTEESREEIHGWNREIKIPIAVAR